MLTFRRTALASLALLFAAACGEAPTQVTDAPPRDISTITDAAPASSQGSGADVVRASISGTFLFPCTGELIEWSGEAVFVDRFATGSAGVHRLDLLQLHASGIGLASGDLYRISQAGGLRVNGVPVTGPISVSQVIPLTIVNTTTGTVFRGVNLFHLTRNASGGLVVEFFRADFECRGR